MSPLLVFLGAVTTLGYQPANFGYQPTDLRYQSDSSGYQPSIFNEFTARNTQFAARVYKELLKTNSNNFLVCPLSVQFAISLAHAGARGNTAAQLAAGVNLPDDKTKLQQFFQQLAPYFQITEPYILTSANKIYVADRFRILNYYKNIANNIFGADVENAVFSQNYQAASQINRWVEGKTYGKIKNLIQPDYLDEYTVAVLVNAMYFKANWLEQFDPRLTSRKDFSVNSNRKEQVDMMNSRGYFNFYEDKGLNAQFLELPYEGKDVTMTFVLPKHTDGLSALEARIDEVLADHPYRTDDTDISIPKFTIGTDVNFKPILAAFGVEIPFTASADFHDMGDYDRPIFISQVLQKAFIEVNEKGTTAAASTAVLVEDKIGPSRRFIADHPFIFFLKHKVSGVFFIGRVTNPTTSTS